MFFHKKNRYELDMTTANNALQNILSTCNQPVNTIPFDKLVLRKKINAASYNRLIIATAVIFVLTFLSPLIIVPLSELNDRLFAPAPAELTLDYVENNVLSLKFTGDNILYNDAYMETLSGERISPLSVDVSDRVISFPFLSEEANIYIPVKNGTTIHLLFTPDHVAEMEQD